MRNYLHGREPVSLELIKNPAESIHPAVLEELLGARRDGVERHFPQLPVRVSRTGRRCWKARRITTRLSQLIDRAGDKLKTAKNLH